MAIPTARANELLDANHAVGTYTALTGPLHARLATATGTAGATGTEVVTGGGYTSGTGAPTFTMGAASAASSANTTAVTVTNWPRAETVTGLDVFDSAGTPKRTEFGALSSPKTMASGDTFSIAIGALTSALA
jgi:hypothetical protein